jgi:hypothetical protein
MKKTKPELKTSPSKVAWVPSFTGKVAGRNLGDGEGGCVLVGPFDGPILPTDSAERKAMPIYSGVVAYFHDALSCLPLAEDRTNEACSAGIVESLLCLDLECLARDSLSLLENLEAARLGRSRRAEAETFLDRYPLALAAVARVSKAGNDKHNPGEPLGWARGKSADHADCIARHYVDRYTLTDGEYRDAAEMAWRALALLQTEREATLGLPPSRGSR